MIISEFLNQIKNLSEYVNNSLYLKSSDNYGCVYKYLIKISDTAAIRVEVFVELDPQESELNLEDKTLINNIEVNPAK